MRSYNSPLLQLFLHRQRAPHAVAAALECTCQDKDPTSASALEVRDLMATISEMCLNINSTLNTSSSLLHKTIVMAAYDTAAQKGSINS